MSRLRRRVWRAAAALLFAAFLLVPLLERGHHHRSRDLARPCAVCAVVHHSPAVPTPLLAVAAAFGTAATAPATPVVAPLPRDRSPRRGRAPPFAPPIASV